MGNYSYYHLSSTDDRADVGDRSRRELRQPLEKGGTPLWGFLVAAAAPPEDIRLDRNGLTAADVDERFAFSAQEPDRQGNRDQAIFVATATASHALHHVDHILVGITTLLRINANAFATKASNAECETLLSTLGRACSIFELRRGTYCRGLKELRDTLADSLPARIKLDCSSVLIAANHKIAIDDEVALPAPDWHAELRITRLAKQLVQALEDQCLPQVTQIVDSLSKISTSPFVSGDSIADWLIRADCVRTEHTIGHRLITRYNIDQGVLERSRFGSDVTVTETDLFEPDRWI